MLRNYFTIAWRSLLGSRGYAFINITGLAVGMAGAALILLWIQNEISFDRFHSKADRLYEVWNQRTFEGKVGSWDYTPTPLGPALKAGFPEIVNTARYKYDEEALLLAAGDNRFTQAITYADPDFFKMFDFPLLQGNRSTLFSNPASIVISQKLAKKLFGDADPMNQIIRLDNQENLMVTGVLKDLPSNTRFKLDAVLSFSLLEYLGYLYDDWGNNWLHTFVELNPGGEAAQVNAKIKGTTKRHSDEDVELFLHPLREWHLYSRFENGKIAGGRIERVRLFGLIAAFVLLIACINFVNLSTARSGKRLREVGVRKVAGAGRGLLIGQFISESVLMALFAGVIAAGLVLVVLPAFNNLTGQALYIPYTSPLFWVMTLGFILFTGLLAGSYPAFFLSSFKPVRALKGTFMASRTGFMPRKVLVVMQFTFAIILIIATLIVRQQIRYAQNREPGYNKDQLIYHGITGDIGKNYELIRNELLASGAALSVCKTASPISQEWSNTYKITWEGKAQDDQTGFERFSADADLVKTAGLELLAGRDIDVRTFPTDSSALLLNESAVKAMGFDDPIGQIVKDDGRDWRVVGVVKDFITRSPYQEIAPMVIEGPHRWSTTVHIRLNGHQIAQNLKATEKIFRKYNPQFPFEYHFVDEEYARKFAGEQRTAGLASLFSGLAIFISCLGLFGLAAYSAEQRSKEIGLRKVLGASVSSVAALLSKDFIKLVLIAILIATPVAWYAMNRWLENFTYRVELQWWMFALAGLLAVVIALLTVSLQSVKAALMNPVKSLRSE